MMSRVCQKVLGSKDVVAPFHLVPNSVLNKSAEVTDLIEKFKFRPLSLIDAGLFKLLNAQHNVPPK